MPQYTDPFISLLDIEIAQIFIAQDRIRNTGFSQMCLTQVNPFGAKFCFLIQQRSETGTECCDPPGGFHTDNALCRDFHQTHPLGYFGGEIRQEIVQYQRIGMPAGGGKFFIFSLTRTQGAGVFVKCFRSVHTAPSFEMSVVRNEGFAAYKAYFCSYYIIPNFTAFCNKKVCVE